MKRRDFIRAAGIGATGVGAVLATPALSQNAVILTIVSTWPRDFPGLGTSAQRLSARIAELSRGEINVRYFAANERVGAFDSFDDVASGNSQAYIAADYYWKGKHPSWSYFATVPFGLTYNEMNAWLNFGGGQELWDELAGEFGLKCLPCGSPGLQMGGWFTKEINSAEDLKGLKMRIPGLGGDVMSKLGVSPVSLPGGQIYENLVSGAIDAAEWVGPYNDFFMKFYEAAKYYYWPGMHEPGISFSFGMNETFWSGLSEAHKQLIIVATREEHALQAQEATANNGKFLTRLIEENGVELREFSDEIYESFGQAAEEVFEEVRRHSPLAKKVDDSFREARAEIGKWLSLSDIAYSQKRNAFLGIGE